MKHTDEWTVRTYNGEIAVNKKRKPLMVISCKEIWAGNRRICSSVNDTHAPLIAAAPKLLEELKKADEIIVKLLDMVRDRRQTVIPDTRISEREDAIAEAEGR